MNWHAFAVGGVIGVGMFVAWKVDDYIWVVVATVVTAGIVSLLMPPKRRD